MIRLSVKTTIFSLTGFVIGMVSAHAVTITTIEPVITIGQWSNAYPATPGSVSIVDLTGEGGNLENNAPLGNGALRLETTASSASRAEVRIVDNFGTIGNFIQHGSLSYDYYHDSSGASTTVVPAIKFEVIDYSNNNGGAYATFIFEPVYNNVGPLTFDDWNSASITGTNGNFWHTALYNVNGNVYSNTLADWNDAFNTALGGGSFLDTFLNANIFSISLGLGSGTPNELGFVDNVNFSSRNVDGSIISLAADFEMSDVATVPLPAALPLYGTGIALLGLMGWRKRRKSF